MTGKQTWRKKKERKEVCWFETCEEPSKEIRRQQWWCKPQKMNLWDSLATAPATEIDAAFLHQTCTFKHYSQPPLLAKALDFNYRDDTEIITSPLLYFAFLPNRLIIANVRYSSVSDFVLTQLWIPSTLLFYGYVILIWRVMLLWTTDGARKVVGP